MPNGCRIYFTIRDQSWMEDECYEWAHEGSPAPIPQAAAPGLLSLLRTVLESHIKDNKPILLQHVQRNEEGDFTGTYPIIFQVAHLKVMMVWAQGCEPGDDLSEGAEDPDPVDKTQATPPAPKVPAGGGPDPADWWKNN